MAQVPYTSLSDVPKNAWFRLKKPEGFGPEYWTEWTWHQITAIRVQNTRKEVVIMFGDIECDLPGLSALFEYTLDPFVHPPKSPVVLPCTKKGS